MPERSGNPSTSLTALITSLQQSIQNQFKQLSTQIGDLKSIVSEIRPTVEQSSEYLQSISAVLSPLSQTIVSTLTSLAASTPPTPPQSPPKPPKPTIIETARTETPDWSRILIHQNKTLRSATRSATREIQSNTEKWWLILKEQSEKLDYLEHLKHIRSHIRELSRDNKGLLGFLKSYFKELSDREEADRRTFEILGEKLDSIGEYASGITRGLLSTITAPFGGIGGTIFDIFEPKLRRLIGRGLLGTIKGAEKLGRWLGEKIDTVKVSAINLPKEFVEETEKQTSLLSGIYSILQQGFKRFNENWQQFRDDLLDWMEIQRESALRHTETASQQLESLKTTLSEALSGLKPSKEGLFGSLIKTIGGNLLGGLLGRGIRGVIGLGRIAGGLLGRAVSGIGRMAGGLVKSAGLPVAILTSALLPYLTSRDVRKRGLNVFKTYVDFAKHLPMPARVLAFNPVMAPYALATSGFFSKQMRESLKEFAKVYVPELISNLTLGIVKSESLKPLGELVATIQEAVYSLPERLGMAVADAVKSNMSFIASLPDEIAASIHQTATNIAEEVYQALVDFWQSHIEGFIKDKIDPLLNIVGNVTKATLALGSTTLEGFFALTDKLARALGLAKK